MNEKIYLPEEFELYREKIEATLKPLVFLTRVREENPQDNPLESKLGGTPYRLRGQDWPIGRNGIPMVFLAQLNFAELPHIPDFPQSGILQFFIGKDDGYGKSWDGQDNNFEVRWIELPFDDVSQLDVTIEDQTPDEIEGPIPGYPAWVTLLRLTPFEEKSKGWKLVGEAALKPVSLFDSHFDEWVGQYLEDDRPSPDEDYGNNRGEWLQAQYTQEVIGEDQYQVGGHPDFAQDDPRRGDGRILLFQCISESSNYDVEPEEEGVIRWGDMGLAHFFIHPDDLKRRDFSRVSYNWDCQ